MKTITGDLVQMAYDGEFDIIVHGCNCQRNMGAGIAKQIARVFPEAKKVDQNANPKMGHYSIGWCSRGEGKLSVAVVNGYTQFWPGRARSRERDTYMHRLSSIRRLFETLNIDFPASTPMKWGIPLLGAGLAGGSWKDIEPIIEAAMPRQHITLVRLP